MHSTPRKRRLWPYLLLLALAGAVIALPTGLERWARTALETRFDGRATLDLLEINPFTGSLHLAGLRIIGDQRLLLEVDDLELDVNLLALLRGSARLSRFHLDGARGALERAADGTWQFDGRPVAALSVAGLALVLDVVSLSNLTLNLQGPDWRHELFVSQAHLTDIDTTARGGGYLIVDGRIDGAPIRVSARLSNGGSPSQAVGRIDIEALDLAALTDLWLDVPNALQGRLEAGFDLMLGNGKADTIELAGRATLNRGALRLGEQTMGAGTLAWDGKVLLRRDNGWHAGLNGQLTGAALHGEGLAGNPRLDASSLDWRGELEIKLGPESLRIRHLGAGALGALRRDGGQVRDTTASRLAWDGDLQLEHAVSSPWVLRYDGTVDAEGLVHDGLAAGRVHWDGSVHDERGQAGASGQLDGTLALTATLTGPEWTVETGDMVWRGAAEWSASEAGATVSVTVDLDGEGLVYQDDASGLNARVSAFTLSGGPMHIAIDEMRTLIRQEMALSLGSSMVAGSFGQLVLHEGLSWDGPVVITSVPDENFAVDARGRLTSPTGDVALAGSDLTFSQARIDWDGLVHYQSGGNGLSIDGGLTLIAPTAVNNTHGGVLFDAVDISVERLSLSHSSGLSASGVVVSSPRFSSTEVDSLDATVAAGDRLTVSAFTWSEAEALRLGEVFVAGFRARILRTPAGLQLPLFMSRGEQREDDLAPRSGWAVASLRLAPGARLTFDDRVVTGEYRADILIDRAELLGLDSRDRGAVASLELEARHGEFTTLTVTGMLQPEPGAIRAVLHGKLRDLDLTPLSPYAEAYLGHRIRYGLADADLQLTLGEEGGGGRQQLTLRTLSVAPLSTDEQAALHAQLGMSLRDVFERLRDPKGDIKLVLRFGDEVPDRAASAGGQFRQHFAAALNTAAEKLRAGGGMPSP